jgi:hypothetical protein
MRVGFAKIGVGVAVGAALLVPGVVGAWGERGHTLVNQLAIEVAANDLPGFMKAGSRQLIFNGYEPDRWRQESGTPMNTAQAPDHFFDSELWGPIATIEADRYAFLAKFIEKKGDPVKVGYLPYAILENYGRLRNALRQWRNAKTGNDKKLMESNALYHAGILGHYVADSTMPMHLSIHFNGWAEGAPNPKGFTTDRGFHSRYENAYVTAAIDAGRVKALMRRPRRLHDILGNLKVHLQATFADLEPIYVLEKEGEFNPQAPRERGTTLIAGQLARGAVMLEDLWYTAWVESGEPIPQTPQP